MVRRETHTMRKHTSSINKPHGGLVKRKAEQGRHFYFCSTINIITFPYFTYIYSFEIIGIDSS